MYLNKLHHVAIICANYEQAKDFYVNKLQLPLVREVYRPERRDHILTLLAGDVEDIEPVIRWLNDMGIETEPVRTDPFTGGRMTFFRDPDGLPLELHE